MVKPSVIVDTIKLALVAVLTMLLNLLQAPPSKALSSSVDALWADDDDKIVTTPSNKTRKTKARRTKAKAIDDEAIVDILKRRALDSPDKVVYTFLDDAGKESVNLTFADVDQAARKVAATLQHDAGVKKGDRVMLAYPPGLDFAVGFWGCLYAGAIGIPVYPPYPGTLAKDLPKFNRMVEDSGAKVILTNRTYYMATQLATAKSYFSGAATWPKGIQWFSTDALSSAMADRYEPVNCTFSDVAFFQYSSGSTSEPKAVVISHGNIHAQLKTWASIREEDTMVSWLPSYHDMGLVGFILVPVSTGARCVSMSPLAFIKDPSLWMRVASQYKGTHVCAPNFGYALAARKTTKAQVAAMDLRHLRQCICAAEPIRVESLNAFTETFSPAGFKPKTFNCGYGLAEVTLVVTGQDPYKLHEPTVLMLQKSALEQQKKAVDAPKNHKSTDTCTLVGCGIPMPTFRVVVVDPDTHVQLKDNCVGEIWIQGPSVAQGYWHREDYTKEQFQATLKEHRGSKSKSHHYLRSGDMGFLRNGQTFTTGRLKDLIIVRGRNVCPQDVEHTVELSDPEVRPGCVAAFSIETADQEEALVVVAEMRSDLRKDQDKLRVIAGAIATAVLSEHQLRCAAIVLLRPRSIPKTTSGKIQRRGTKAKFEDGTLAAQYIHKGVVETTPKAKTPVPETATVAKTVEGVVRTPEEIETWLVERLGQEATDGAEPAGPIDPTTPWACMGMDSVAIVGLSAE
ncbi:fatty-acid-CoA ligase, partial [Achlya hypogyna]